MIELSAARCTTCSAKQFALYFVGDVLLCYPCARKATGFPIPNPERGAQR